MLEFRSASADGVHGGERRRDDDLHAATSFTTLRSSLAKTTASWTGLEHLPVAGDEGDVCTAVTLLPAALTCLILPLSAATPRQRTCPPRNSSEAPPPVEMCVIGRRRPPS